jgi:hypothetical protein
MKSFRVALIALLALVAQANAQNVSPNATPPQAAPQASGPAGNENTDRVVGSGSLPDIQSAVTAAGSSGSVLIRPGYPGNDTWTNPHNVRIIDRRPFNPSNSPTYSNQPMPSTTIKAAEYGALCNGSNDDWPAIQAAANAATTVSGGVEVVPPLAMGNATVELPQGRCNISQPIVLMNYGSIEGSGNGTWLTPAGTWSKGDDALIQIVQSYDRALYKNQRTSGINRFVKNINFLGWRAHNITGIKVYNQTGTSKTMPYPYQAQLAEFQIPGVTVEGNAFYSMDTAIDMEDCGECHILNNQIFFVRVGIIDGGNNFSLYTDNNAIQAGTYNYTTLRGATMGVTSYSEGNRWMCATAACTSAAQTAIASPQGFIVSHSIITTFDIDANIVNCQGLGLIGNGFDYGGSGPQNVANPAVFIGHGVIWAQIAYNLIANGRGDSPALELGAPTSAATDSPYYNGLWIESNFIQGYQSASPQGFGVLFDKGTFARRNVWIQNNQFSQLGYGVVFSHPVTYSIVRGNYGYSLTYALIDFNAAGSASFQSTVVADNTTPDRVDAVHDNSGTGYIAEYNQSATQLTGTFTATGSGCSISPGAIGNSCLATVVNPIPFGNLAYKVTGCAVTGATGAVVISTVSSATATGQFPVSETAMSTTATGGGTIACTVVHN